MLNKILLIVLLFTAATQPAEANICRDILNTALAKIGFSHLIPAARYHFDPTIYDRYVDAQPKETRDIFRKIGRNIRHITMQEFETELKATFDRFIDTAKDTNIRYFVPDFGFSRLDKKSNLWVANAFKAYVRKKEPGLTSRLIFLYYQEFQRMKKDDELLILDDASYSGQQIHRIIIFFEKSKVNIVVPFLSRTATKKIAAPHRPKVSFWGRGIIDTVEQIAQRENLDLDKMQAIFGDDCGERTITFFDHKVPDRVSSLGIFEEELYAPDDKLPKNSRKKYRITYPDENLKFLVKNKADKNTKYNRPILLE